MFHRKYERTKDVADLSAAISHAESAIAISSGDVVNDAAELNYLGVMKLWRYQRTNKLEDLDDVISNVRTVIDSLAIDHSAQADSARHNLASMLLSRFQEKPEKKDLDEAISLGCEEHD